MSEANTSRVRTIPLWTALSLTAALFALSIYGSFSGSVFSIWGYTIIAFPRDAKVFFNGTVLAAFWIALTAFLMAGVILSPRILTRWPSLAMHVGAVLVLVGSMWNSASGHAMANEWLHSAKVLHGYVTIGLGAGSEIRDTSNSPLGILRFPHRKDGSWMDPYVDADGQVPFSLHLNRFWMDRYTDEASWPIRVELTEPTAASTPGSVSTTVTVPVEWSLNKEVEVPQTGFKLKVLKFQPRAKLSFSGMLRIQPSEGEATEIPAQEGKEAQVEKPKATVRVLKYYANVQAKNDENGKPQLSEAPESSGVNTPAAHVEVDLAGKRTTHWVIQSGMMPQLEGIRTALVPAIKGVTEDRNSSTGAMYLALTSPANERALIWMILPPELDTMGFRLSSYFPKVKRDAILYVRPTIQCFSSDVDVVVAGKTVDHAVIQVNHPFHFGGYHFYQHGYDDVGGEYSILSVTSDSGLLLVWVGMAALLAGTFWFFWCQPAIAWLRQRRAPAAGEAK